MDSLQENRIVGIPVRQNKQDFILGVFRIEQVFKFTKYTQRFIVGFDENEQPIYNPEIQRTIENSRVKEIADFLINNPDATFPTNIILHLPIEIIEEQEKKGDTIEITLNEKVFSEIKKNNGDIFITIIDGQHRICGIQEAINRLENDINIISKTNRNSSSISLDEKHNYYVQRLNDLKNIELVVSFFVDKTLEYQAMIFSTINRTQKRVSQSLVSSLFGLDTKDTPQKSSLEIVLSLNGHPNSPFYKRIKLYGGNYSRNSSPPLTQATMVKSIVSLISENLKEAENDRYRNRNELNKRTAGSSRFLPFRKYYANDKDNVISDILFYFFNAVRNTFNDINGNSLWNMVESGKPENILHTTVGYDSLLKILVDILQEQNIKINSTSVFEPYLNKCKGLKLNDGIRYPFNNKGKKILYLDMSLAIWPFDPNDNKDNRLNELKEITAD
ncbi:MAG: DGQHR domain-containing protein [Lutibacter sp.]|nr:DGQHR domain-containing protein [Lutibacter sp.]